MNNFFKLVATWLDCRWHELHVKGDKVFFLIGELDYWAEIELEEKERARSAQ